MVEPNVFIFLGEDESKKQEKLISLQNKIFPPDLKDFNYTLFYGDDKDLTISSLRDVLAYFPTPGAKRRLVVIRKAHKLPAALKSWLAAQFAAYKDTWIVLDVCEAAEEQDWTRRFPEAARIFSFAGRDKIDAFGLARAIIARQPQAALKLFARIYASRQKAEKILGAIYWQWDNSYTTRRLSPEAYKKGIRFILEADKRLKSTQASIRQRLTIEAMIVKLSYLA